MAPMFEFDEDRPSITGRKISSNIPPAVPGYEYLRPWLKWIVLIYLLPIVFLLLAVFFYR
jgi:hypothetical protein